MNEYSFLEYFALAFVFVAFIGLLTFTKLRAGCAISDILIGREGIGDRDAVGGLREDNQPIASIDEEVSNENEKISSPHTGEKDAAVTSQITTHDSDVFQSYIDLFEPHVKDAEVLPYFGEERRTHASESREIRDEIVAALSLSMVKLLLQHHGTVSRQKKSFAPLLSAFAKHELFQPTETGYLTRFSSFEEEAKSLLYNPSTKVERRPSTGVTSARRKRSDLH